MSKQALVKQVYRCIITVTDSRCSEPVVSNMFFSSTWPLDQIKDYANKAYRKMLAEHGYPDDLEWVTEVYPSSEEEAELYRRGMQTGQVSRNVN